MRVATFTVIHSSLNTPALHLSIQPASFLLVRNVFTSVVADREGDGEWK